MSVRGVCIGLLALALNVVSPLASSDVESAKQAVESFHSALLSVMRDADTLGYAGRRDQLQPAVENHFDIPYITGLVMGRHWDKLTPQEQAQMVATFGALTLATYATRFDGFAGEEFKILELKPLKKERTLVRSVLDSPSGRDVSLDYVLHDTEDGWRIINVIADDVSELSIKRSEYNSVLSSEGFTSLVSKLREQIDEMETRP